jgi:hypothetical protein
VFYYADGRHYEGEWVKGVEVTSSDSSGNSCSIC